MANQGLVEVDGLPAAPLDAAALFHASFAPRVRALAAQGDVVAVFPPAGPAHRDWRLAAIRDLARAAVPNRVNGVVESAAHDSVARVSDVLYYLQSAAGVTGQVFEIDGPEPDGAKAQGSLD